METSIEELRPFSQLSARRKENYLFFGVEGVGSKGLRARDARSHEVPCATGALMWNQNKNCLPPHAIYAVI